MKEVMHALCLGTALLMVSPATPAGNPGTPALEPELQPGYLRWVRGPAELFGFWHTPDPVETQVRTGANARSIHRTMQIVHEDNNSPRPAIVNDFETTQSLSATGPHDLTASPVSVSVSDPTPESAPMHYGVGLGEHNNVFFVRYPKSFMQAFPQSFMCGPDGAMICRGPGDPPTVFMPVPAIDDPVITGLACEQIRTGAGHYARERAARYYVIGGEEFYPQYVGWERADFRPAALDHFARYCEAYHRNPVPCDTVAQGHALSKEFNETAVGERAACYMRAFLGADASRPVLYPTHGHPFLPFNTRSALGHVPALIAAACDGFETGQITVDADVDELNLLTLAHLTAYGKPVVSPRLANKQIDRRAQGGGCTFSPQMLRRAVYEAVGMGVWHIGLVQWVGDLPDGEWHIKDTPAETEAKRVFTELKTAAPFLLGMSRLQPRVALYVSDAQWRMGGWNSRWTGFFQDALAAGWNITVIGDAMLSQHLSRRVPLLVAINDEMLAGPAARGMHEYLEGGGRLITVGGFGTSDDRCSTVPERLRLRHARCMAVRAQYGPRRLLPGRTTTTDGAHDEEREYLPVQFESIAGAARGLVSHADLRPISMNGHPSASVRVFPLTDGQTVAAVLVNSSSQAVRVDVSPALAGEWEEGYASQISDRESETAEPEHEAKKLGRVVLGSHGTAILWWHPRGTADSRWEDARSSVNRWREVGSDVAGFDALLAAASGLTGREQEPKRAGLVRQVLDSLAVATTVSQSATDGILRIATKVFDSGGLTLDTVDVEATLVPGDGRPVALVCQNGTCLAEIPVNERPLSFDVQRRRYVPLSGPVRLIVSARAGQKRGMSISLLSLVAP